MELLFTPHDDETGAAFIGREPGGVRILEEVTALPADEGRVFSIRHTDTGRVHWARASELDAFPAL